MTRLNDELYMQKSFLALPVRPLSCLFQLFLEIEVYKLPFPYIDLTQFSIKRWSIVCCKYFKSFLFILIFSSIMYSIRKSDFPDIQTNNQSSTYRQYKSKRNHSLPDMSPLSKDYHSKSKEKLKYNKWFIKPELRLKASIV